ncbi:hypothetical protein MHYP_G00180100 [Metynnis hypsauchen]
MTEALLVRGLHGCRVVLTPDSAGWGESQQLLFKNKIHIHELMTYFHTSQEGHGRLLSLGVCEHRRGAERDTCCSDLTPGFQTPLKSTPSPDLEVRCAVNDS